MRLAVAGTRSGITAAQLTANAAGATSSYHGVHSISRQHDSHHPGS
jgi:hypothetical protein